jgi:hypothetical protein
MNNKTTKLLTCAAFMAGAAALQGAALVQYNFDSIAEAPAPKSPTVTLAGVTASDVLLTGMTEDTSRSNVLAFTNADNSIATDDFLSFSLSTTATFDFETDGAITFTLGRHNGGSDPTTNFISVVVNSGLAQHTFPNIAVANSSQNLSLAGLNLSGTTTLDVTINVSRSETWSDANIDSLTVVGAVPEPSTYALLAGLGALAFIVIRRRRA